jgi:hypothetical protein
VTSVLRLRTPGSLVSLVLLVILAMGATFASVLGCHEDPPRVRHEPMRTPAADPAELPALEASRAAPTRAGELGVAGDEAPAPLTERPPADPAITKALDLISASGLRFIDQAADEDSKPSEYTAEQFASMLRTKWDWIGYDISELEPWVEEIASRSFKTNLPYQVVLGDGTSVELRGWLGQQQLGSE